MAQSSKAASAAVVPGVPVGGVILAGGRSRRMGGGDKPLRLLNERTLLRHVIDRLRPQAAAIAINANGDPDRFAAYGLPVIADAPGGSEGPLAGVLAGMRWAAALGTATHIATVPGDTPFLPDDLVSALWEEAAGAADHIAVAASGGRTHPPVALWPVGLADDLALFLGEGTVRKVSAFIERHRWSARTFAGRDGADPFFNINKPDDLVEAKRILEKR